MARKSRDHSATQTGNGRSRTSPETKPATTTQQHTGSVPLNPEKLKRLYSTMLKCRMIEEKVGGLSIQGKIIGDRCPAVGQEATEVGAAIDLLSEDCIAISDRDFISGFIQGTPLKLIFARLCARPASTDQPDAAPTHNGSDPLKTAVPEPSITAQLNIATGVALAYKMQKRPLVVLVFCRAEPISSGLWHEALRLAGARKLPIVFMIESNSWDEPASIRRPSVVEDLGVKARSYGFPGIAVDGNDVVAVFRVAQEAIRRAREGHGSALIECKTYRWSGHSGAEEAEYWKAKDPVLFMENYLKRRNLWSDEWKQNVVDDFSREMDAAVALTEQPSEPVRRKEQVHSFEVLDGELKRIPLRFRRRVLSPAKLSKS